MITLELHKPAKGYLVACLSNAGQYKAALIKPYRDTPKANNDNHYKLTLIPNSDPQILEH